MKIAITGHTRGLGKTLLARLPDAVGFSRAEISIDDTDALVSAVEPFDVFINNACSGFSQTRVLLALFERWKYTDKTIVNIGSRSKYPNISKGFEYSAAKASLSHTSDSLRFLADRRCRIIDINPGLMQSDLPSVTYSEVADAVLWAINLPGHVEVGELSLWHKTPYAVVSRMKDAQKPPCE